ncbi:hypothetical protein [Falsirhodobacter halotolerans]|uniref:hypothetical protein n=1 Tax=Falsirhodobacter halotolerans TaxID=1146892 RepID=UPI001FD24ED8|nr:hypothetical protein [Falsirhodobacter halotolerans]MCJ8139937.1 hypothetical protein [Falsirhodobacter halotolerans]
MIHFVGDRMPGGPMKHLHIQDLRGAIELSGSQRRLGRCITSLPLGHEKAPEPERRSGGPERDRVVRPGCDLNRPGVKLRRHRRETSRTIREWRAPVKVHDQLGHQVDMRAFGHHPGSPRLGLVFEVRVWQGDKTLVLRPKRVAEDKPGVDGRRERVPQATAGRVRRMRVVGPDDPTGQHNHARQDEVDLHASGMGVRVGIDGRSAARRNAREGHLQREGQDARHAVAIGPPPCVEVRDGDVR